MPRISSAKTMPKELVQQQNLLVRKGFSSPIWKYFGFPTDPNDPTEPANEEEVVCALCGKSLAYNKSTTVMHKHLKGRHPSVFESISFLPPGKRIAKGKLGKLRNQQDVPSSEEESFRFVNLLQNKNLIPKDNGASPIWTFFGFPTNPDDPTKVLNDDAVVCAICDRKMKYPIDRSTSGMRNHLSKLHPWALSWLEEKGVSFYKASQSSAGQHADVKRKRMVPRRSSSWVWNYFYFPSESDTDKPTKDAVCCDLCQKRMSYHGGTSVMRNHIRLIHKREFAEHNQWEAVEVSQEAKDINAADPKVQNLDEQGVVTDGSVAMSEEEIYAEDLLKNKSLLQKRGAHTSPIWRFFGFPPDPNNPEEFLSTEKVICALCGRQLIYSNSSTTVMRNHLDHVHPNVFKFIMRTPKLLSSASGEKRQHRSSAMMPSRRRRLSTCIATYIAKDLKPLSSLSEPSFRKMLAEFDPRYTLPAREMFALQIIPKLYEEVKEHTVMPAVRGAKHIALSIDMWGRSTIEQYMAVNAHILTSDWELKSFMLENVEFPLPHDATHIAECLNDVAADWSICDDPIKITALVTNNAIKNSFTGKHVPCLGHTLNSVVVAGLECPGVKVPIGNCCQLAEFILSSPKLKITVEESAVAQPPMDTSGDLAQQYESSQQLDVQGQLDVLEQLVTAAQIGVEDHADISELAAAAPPPPSGNQQEESLHVTMQDMTVPLGSTHSMLRGIRDKRDLLKTVLGAAERNDLDLSEADIKIVDEVEKVLDPLQTLSETFLGKGYVTASGMLPSVYYLKAVLKDKPDDLPEIVEMKQAMSRELSDVFDDPSLSLILPKATFLDARYKKLPFMTDVERGSLHDDIAKEATLLSDAKVGQELAVDEEPAKKKLAVAWASLLGDMFGEENVDVEEAKGGGGGAKDEIRRYITEPRLSLDSDPLKWWQQNGPRYPMLSAMAMRYLCIPSTSVPSEHIFSSVGSIMAAKRTLLDAKDMQLLPFLNANLE